MRNLLLVDFEDLKEENMSLHSEIETLKDEVKTKDIIIKSLSAMLQSNQEQILRLINLKN